VKELSPGAYLVSEGVITGQELSDIQNVIGMALGGGALSIGLVISIISAIPKQLVSAGYDKAVEKYGQVKVDNVFNKIDDVVALMQSIDTKLDTVKAELDNDRELRETILKG
jgi:hypothetical protein